MSPETLNTTEQLQLLETMLHDEDLCQKSSRRIRNYTIALLMLDAGLRIHEVTQLRQTDIFIAGGPVTSLKLTPQQTKGKTERLIPLSGRLQESIAELSNRAWYLSISDISCYAFFTNNPHKPISDRQVQRIIAAASLKAFSRAIHPHVLRHTFASTMMRITSMPVVQELLGHKQLSSTQVYTHPNADDKVKAIKDAESPQGEERKKHEH